MSLQDAAMRLNSAMDMLKQSVAEFDAPSSPPGALDDVEAHIKTLLASGERIEAAAALAAERLETLSAGLASDPLRILHDRISAERQAAASAFDEAVDAFASLPDEFIEKATEEVEAWFSESIEALGGELEAAIEDIEGAAKDRAGKLVSDAANSVAKIGNDIVTRVTERAQESGRDIVNAAVERAVAEVADTIVTTQLGATITTAIGPYLPVIIAIKPALPAIQEALDIMRGEI